MRWFSVPVAAALGVLAVGWSAPTPAQPQPQPAVVKLDGIPFPLPDTAPPNWSCNVQATVNCNCAETSANTVCKSRDVTTFLYWCTQQQGTCASIGSVTCPNGGNGWTGTCANPIRETIVNCIGITTTTCNGPNVQPVNAAAVGQE